ncbi:winged helix-turn-helix transcriptional regulator [Chryseobacterium sp. PTM-20240506]|jgi:DNA-binding HxlR family transcriptional regulator|uniref:winged helix-turn-helix transcriptional regulator n=1 Tax=Chryseobacterium TaxID=59732 RepID=UPI002017F871|nr:MULTISPECIES: winged helix-turn-helix transcriptional regulator [Chryseobacterium]MDC8104482.1 winged helix-turn-helix transcriptional regulator [Chryseobacterium sp. B21-037]MDQ1804096.1 winged helix-turn-helix transcriptional regulator [Chryseobacterium sp. CKR4-1]
MELNKLVKCIVCPETPVLIEYEPTECCPTFGKIINEMINWGREHRKIIILDKKIN